MKNTIAKIQRLLVSRNIMKIFRLLHYIQGGYKSKKIKYLFDKKSRLEIVQNILIKIIFYLEIGAFRDELLTQ